MFLTASVKYILDPDKEALPWRRYCNADHPSLYSLQPSPISSSSSSTLFGFGAAEQLSLQPLSCGGLAWPYGAQTPASFEGELQSDLSDLEPVGVFVGVFTVDAAVKRRNLIRMSYGSHPRSRTPNAEGLRMRFIMGRPSARYRKAIELEIEAFNDIVILDIPENMNAGKTHAYFTWAARHAMVPDIEHSILDLPVPASSADVASIPAPVHRGERRPQYIVKADDDSFIMLGELERKLRVVPRNMAYWGYLVKSQFMGGECYAMSLDLAQYIATSNAVSQITHGKEDKLVSQWMRMHPQREEIVWVAENCWIYDHPRASTVYSHGFLYPSEVVNVRREHASGFESVVATARGLNAHAYSTVSKFGSAFRRLPVASAMERVESLIEGSPLSQLRDYPQAAALLDGHTTGMTLRQKIGRLFAMRPTRNERFLGDKLERGGTVVVHYIKRKEWFIETMIALLGTAEESQKWETGAGAGVLVHGGLDDTENAL